MPKYEAIPLRSLFPSVLPEALELLEHLLCVSPEHRVSAKDALKLPYFADVPPLVEVGKRPVGYVPF